MRLTQLAASAHLPFDLRAENIAETYAVKLVARVRAWHARARGGQATALLCCAPAVQRKLTWLCGPQLPSTRYEVVCFNRPPASSTKDAVCAFVNERRPFLLAVGCTGRKGPRECVRSQLRCPHRAPSWRLTSQGCAGTPRCSAPPPTTLCVPRAATRWW